MKLKLCAHVQKMFVGEMPPMSPLCPELLHCVILTNTDTSSTRYSFITSSVNGVCLCTKADFPLNPITY